MLKTTVLSAVMAGALFVAPTQAQHVNPWQQCGIGAMVFPDNTTAAAISNVIWDLGTTAVSSNVSSVENCEGANVDTGKFIQQTFPVLEQEIAQGEGEYLTAMLNVRGCAVTAHSEIVTAIRGDFANEPAVNAAALYNIVENKINTDFVSSCSAI